MPEEVELFGDEQTMCKPVEEANDIDNIKCPACGKRGPRVQAFSRDYYNRDGDYSGTVEYLSCTCRTCRKEWFINMMDYHTKAEE